MELVLGYRLYALIALAILLGTPLVVHLASSVTSHHEATAPDESETSPAPAIEPHREMAPAAAPPQQDAQPLDPRAVADAAPSLDPQGSMADAAGAEPPSYQPAPAQSPQPEDAPPAPNDVARLDAY